MPSQTPGTKRRRNPSRKAKQQPAASAVSKTTNKRQKKGPGAGITPSVAKGLQNAISTSPPLMALASQNPTVKMALKKSIYAQRKDPTAIPFIRNGHKFMGHVGAKKQRKGQNPTSADIREKAVQSEGLKGGAGLHEVVPTNMRGEVASSGNETYIGMQSGMRTGTARTIFHRQEDPDNPKPIGQREIGMHTGGAYGGYTKGQADAHDGLRETARSVEDETDPHEMFNSMMLSHIDSLALGQEVLGSEYIEGMEHRGDFGEMEPVVPVGKKQGKERLRLAQEQHRGRELVKDRTRSVKRETGRGRSPSPPRRPIDRKGRGGDYESTDRTTYRLVTVPEFEGTPGTFKYAANLGGWGTAPQREGFDPSQI